MTKREKIIKAFEFCLMPASREELENDICSHEDCPYYREYNGGKCISAAASDALALLRAQEPVEPYIERDGRTTFFLCGGCNKPLCIAKESYKSKYCPECGRKVKWDG